jgi:hypothetical protein
MDSWTTAYDVARWTSFFSAETSASAGLTGLLFVAISINLLRIVANPALAARSLKALVTLSTILLISFLCLVPGQSTRVLGVEIAVLGLAHWIAAVTLQYKSVHNNPYVGPKARTINMLLTHASALPMIFAARSLLVFRGGGLYWLVAGTVLCFLTALMDAWVLLIEIQR